MNIDLKQQIERIFLSLKVSPKKFLTNRSEEIKKFEEKLSLNLPIEYRVFLLSFENVFFEDEVIFKPLQASPWASHDGLETLDELFGLSNLQKNMEVYYNRVPNNLIPIGESPGGNLICLGVEGGVKGKVYFWDHENELEARVIIGDALVTDNINDYWENLYLISESFLDFISELALLENTEQRNNKSNAVEVWLDDDLLND